MLKNINNKLKNNGGWGLVEMLILSGILLLALLFAAYLIYKLYSNLKRGSVIRLYGKVEKRVSEYQLIANKIEIL